MLSSVPFGGARALVERGALSGRAHFRGGTLVKTNQPSPTRNSFESHLRELPHPLSKLMALGSRRVQRDAGAPAARCALGREGQPVHRWSSNDGGESDTGGISTFVRRIGRVQAQASGRDRGEYVEISMKEGIILDRRWRLQFL